MLDIEIPVLTYSTVTVTSLRHWFPRGTGEAPRRPPVRGFSMRDIHSKKWARARVVSCAICGDDGKEKAPRVFGAWRPLEILSYRGLNR
jgi:hypothetical protein